MKQTIKKLRNGTVYIFSFFAVIISTLFIVQSCKNDENYVDSNSINNTTELNKFKKAMIKSAEIINKKKIYSRTPLIIDSTAVLFEESIHLEAINLIKSYGITEAEIISEFGSLEDPRISHAAQFILYEEELLLEGHTMNIFDSTDYSLVAFNFIGVNTLYAQTVGGCLGEAAGINLIKDVFEGGIKKLGKKGAMKLVTKVASKYLGWIGAAVMVMEFSECMGWTNLY